MANVESMQLTDLDMLWDFAKDAQVAAIAYTAAAGMANDQKVKERFERMASMALESQERTVKLMRKLGANA